jgi:diguanylate cyclase (GGDEF)-like protein
LQGGQITQRRRSLSLSVALLLALSTLVAMIAGRLAMGISIVPSLNALEEELITRDTLRVQRSIMADLTAVDGVNTDYARWSETLDFIAGTRPHYGDENFDLAFFTGQRINFVLILDRHNRPYFAVTCQDGRLAPLTAAATAQLSALAGRVTSPIIGIGAVDHMAAILFSARPVQLADDPRPPAGTIIMARALDQHYLLTLDRQLDVTVALAPAEAGPSADSNDAAHVHSRLESHLAIGTTLLADSHGHPFLRLTVTAPRALEQTIDHLLFRTSVIIALTAVLTGLVIWALTSFHLLNPLRRISLVLRDLRQERVQSLQSNIGNFLPVRRPDEVGEIASEIVAMHRRIIDLAHRDPLTGCPNRGLFADRVAVAMAHTHRSHHSFALLYIDLNAFKPINDRFGHAAGDAVLVQTAHRLRQIVRDGDTVARLGGDEFAILLDGPVEPGLIAGLIERIAGNITHPIAFDHHQLTVSAAIGSAIYPTDGHTLEELTAIADQRMYAAKAQQHLAIETAPATVPDRHGHGVS